MGFYFFSEAGVLFVYDQAVFKVIELDFYFVFILQDSDLFCDRLGEEIKVGGIFYSCEVIWSEVEEGDVEPSCFIYFFLDFAQEKFFGEEKAGFPASEPLEPTADAALLQLLP